MKACRDRYCYCKLTGPLDLGAVDATVQTVCVGAQELVCEAPSFGCCADVFL